MHGGLFGARQRLYDVPAAVDVLIGGRYPGLPKGIQYCGGDLDPRPIYEVCLIYLFTSILRSTNYHIVTFVYTLVPGIISYQYVLFEYGWY